MGDEGEAKDDLGILAHSTELTHEASVDNAE